MASRSVDTELWSDSKITDEFTPEDKYFWLFLLTTRYGNLSGVFEITSQQIARDMGYSKESVENLIFRFETQHKLISYNKDTKELFIHNWYRYNWTKSPQFERSLMKFVEKIKSLEFKEIVVQMYQDYKESNTVLIPYRYPTKSNTISNTFLSLELDLDFKPNTIKTIDDYFNIFWTVYPYRVGKNKVQEWFVRHKKDITEEFMDYIIKSIELQKTSINWTDKNGQYIPLPMTWLNRGGWNDELRYPQTVEKRLEKRWENFLKDE